MEQNEKESAGQPIEETQPIAESSSEVKESGDKVDWWNPDSWGKKSPKEVVSEIQKEYNDKATKAKRTEQLEREYQAAQEELAKVVQETRAALADENIYREYRRKAGYETDKPVDVPKLDFSKLETVGDVVNSFETMKNYFENRIAQIEKTAESKAEQKIRQAVDPISKERWSVALSAMKDKYGDKWSSSERKVVQAITNGLYAYKPGAEKEILDKAFRGECPDEYEAVVADNFKKRLDEKSKATTATPKSAAPRNTPKGDSTEAIIARANARIKA